MSFLPKSTAEVKQILTVRDLQTEQCSSFLVGDQGPCPWPAATRQWEKCKDIDPEDLVACLDISAPLSESPNASPDPQVIYQRPVRRGETYDLAVTIVRVQARAAERDKDPAFKSAALPDPDPPRGPLKPAKKQGRVVPFPKEKRPKVRANKTPADIVRYASKLLYQGQWLKVLQIMYAVSKYMNVKIFEHYPGKYDRKGRYYYQGIDNLIKLTGLSRRTIRRQLHWMRKQGLIRLCQRGFPEQGASVWELPLNMKQVFAWRKNPKIKTK
jgi:hypothetical protein